MNEGDACRHSPNLPHLVATSLLQMFGVYAMLCRGWMKYRNDRAPSHLVAAWHTWSLDRITLIPKGQPTTRLSSALDSPRSSAAPFGAACCWSSQTVIALHFCGLSVLLVFSVWAWVISLFFSRLARCCSCLCITLSKFHRRHTIMLLVHCAIYSRCRSTTIGAFAILQ